MQPAEEFVLGSATRRDEFQAWLEGIFDEHYPRLVQMLARLTGDRAQAEEIASDVFCKISRRRLILPTEGDRLAWMYRVAMNAGLDALRSNARRRRRERQAGAEHLRTAGESGALEEMLRKERRSRVQSVLAELKARDAQLLMLRASGLAYREMAETLGIHPSSVGTLLSRAEAEFERRFRARYGDNL